MRHEIIEQLAELCGKPDSLELIEEFICLHSPSVQEFTVALSDTINEPCRNIRVYKLALDNGLDPNLTIVYEKDHCNVMKGIFFRADGAWAPQAMRLMLEHGGDVDLVIDGEKLFEDIVDFDILFDVIELDDKQRFESKFQCWLVMMGFGGYINDHQCPVTMLNGHEKSIFARFEKFGCRIEFLKNDWRMEIFDKTNGEIVAEL